MSKLSVFRVAYQEVRRPVKPAIMMMLLILLVALYPSDLDEYPIVPPEAGISAEVDFTENYLRFVPTAIQIALPILLKDKVGLVQLAYVGVSTTIATHAAKRILNDHWVSGTRLGERPSHSDSKHNMPSGHSSMASCALYFVGRRYSIWLALLLTPILFFTMYARIAQDAHTVSAVIAGAFLGILMAALFTSRRKVSADESADAVDDVRRPKRPKPWRPTL